MRAASLPGCSRQLCLSPGERLLLNESSKLFPHLLVHSTNICRGNTACQVFRAHVFFRNRGEWGESTVVGAVDVWHAQILEVGPAESTCVPKELQGMSVGYQVLWPNYVSAMLDFEQRSVTGDFSDCNYVNMPGKSARARTELAMWPKPIYRKCPTHNASLEIGRTFSGKCFSATLCPKLWSAAAGGCTPQLVELGPPYRRLVVMSKPWSFQKMHPWVLFSTRPYCLHPVHPFLTFLALRYPFYLSPSFSPSSLITTFLLLHKK